MLACRCHIKPLIILTISSFLITACSNTVQPTAPVTKGDHATTAEAATVKSEKDRSAQTVLALGLIDQTRARHDSSLVESDDSLRDVIFEELQNTTGATIIKLPTGVDGRRSPSSLMNAHAQYIIQGSTSKRSSSEITSVFLEAVDAESGNVAIAANGRGESVDKAAVQAASRLALELVRQRLIKK